MTVWKSALSPRSAEFQANAEAMAGLVADLRAKVAAVKQGGGAKARDKHLARGKLLPRERVRQLLDVGSPFLELSQLAAHGVYGEDIPAAGIITGIELMKQRIIEGRADSVLRFADAQLKQIPTLTHEDLDAMVARNRSDYVEKVLRFGRFGDADYAAIVALRDRLCDGVHHLFSDDGAGTAAPQEATDSAPDPGDPSAIHHEDRVFRDDRRFKNSVRDVAHEWAQFLHRVSAF